MSRKNLIFRVFVSSTFSDLVAERNALQDRVFPRLRAYCEGHGAQFQAVDLRWGVSQEAALDQQTMDICLDELRRCQQLSPRPNFIVLLAGRYGWRPLPSHIDAAEFAALPGEFGDWYRRDDNAVPAEYRLRPRTGELAEPERWTRQEDQLRAAAAAAFPAGDPRRERYERSATHQEIQHGVFAVDDAGEHVFGYLRSDTDGARQTSLKAELRHRLPAGHVYEWAPPTDLDELCRRVERDLRGTIDAELAAFQVVPPLRRERDAHLAFAEQRAAHFQGRTDLLGRIADYLASGDDRPLVVHGPPGSGKSALLAESSRRLVAAGGPAHVLTRFIGATPASAEPRDLAAGVAEELGQVYDIATALPDDLRALADELRARFAASTADHPLVVYLDALDQLGDADGTRAPTWLPKLGPHTRLVVAMVEADGPAGAALREARDLLPAGQFLEVGPLPLDDGAQLLDTWLAAAGRTLRPRQRRHVLDRFGACPTPLYLRLAFEEARRWRSDDGEPELGQDVPAVLGDMLARLERAGEHGRALPAHGLAYLAASRRGLSEEELLDLLSADERVMDDMRRRSPDSPPVDRLPAVLWSRLLSDLSPYLTRHAVHGAELLTFYHREVETAVRARYLDSLDAHRRLAAYFDRRRTPHALDELPYQLAAAGEPDRLVDLLCDVEFLQAKARAGMVGDLTADLDRARETLGERWNEESPVAAFARFLARESHFLRSAPGALAQQALNSGEADVAAAAARLAEAGGFGAEPWLRKTAGTAQQRHSGPVIAMTFWRGDRYLVVSTTEREVWVWDLARRALHQRFDAPRSAAKSLAVSPGGTMVAAAFGAADPTPFEAGAVVWRSDGRVLREYALDEWVYHVRWRDDTELVLGGGAPSGADATGVLWRADLNAAAGEEILAHLAGGPIVLTWDPVPGETSFLTRDGAVCRLTPEFVPMTAQEVAELRSTVSGMTGLDAAQIDAMVKYGIHARRLPPPGTDEFGFGQAAVPLGPNTIAMLAEPPVPLDLRYSPQPAPNALYVHDLDREDIWGVGFNPRALEAGFRAVCLAGSRDGGEIVLGTAHGETLLVREGRTVEHLHQGDFPVTAVCMSDSGRLVAVGGDGGAITVCDRTTGEPVFTTPRADRPLAGDTGAVLYRDRLEFPSRGTLALPAGETAIDFDRHRDVLMVLTVREDGSYAVHVVDPATRRMVRTTPVPGDIPSPPGTGGSRDDKPHHLSRIRLRAHDGRLSMLLGSVRGLVEYPFPSAERGRPYLLPYDREAADRRHGITMIRDLELPRESCESVAVAPGGDTIYCGYADNEDHPRVSGELRAWTAGTAIVSAGQRFPGAVRALAAAAGGVVVGTDADQAGFWQYDGRWHARNEIRHGAPVVAVGHSPETGRACSASRDGALIVWPCRPGPELRTFVDVEPIAAGFTAAGDEVYLLDRNGERHTWAIVTPR